MATWMDVSRLALAFPQALEGASRGLRSWSVAGKTFAWERPLRRSDLEALGASAPQGPVLAARVESEDMKRALVASRGSIDFTTPHFDDYPAVLVRLKQIRVRELQRLLSEAWLTRAPRMLAPRALQRPPSPSSTRAGAPGARLRPRVGRPKRKSG